MPKPTPSPENSEWLTRKKLIDGKLESAGWDIKRFTPGKPVEEFETANGPSDYVLCAEGFMLGVVEAKPLSLGPQNVFTQPSAIQRTSPRKAPGRGVRCSISAFHEWRGHLASRHPARAEPLAPDQFIPHPDALKEQLQKNLEASCAVLKNHPNSTPRLRPYQREANEAIECAIAERKRQILVAMATGTGKTFTLVL